MVNDKDDTIRPPISANSKNRQRSKECEQCKETFETVYLLRSHKRQFHERILADQQGYAFDESTKRFVCKICNMESCSKKIIASHVKIHEQNYDCYICNKKYTSAYKYSVHLQTHGKDNFKCLLCDYESPNKYSLLKHITRKHFQQYTYHCNVCRRGYDDMASLQEHEIAHKGGKPFACIVCGREYPLSKSLRSHQRKYHRVNIEGVILPNQCPICKRIFSNGENLNKHSDVHKNHLCDICGKGFAYKDGLREHYKIHADEKPHACKHCPKTFIKRQYLVTHERTHSGEKPFTCEFCDRGFSQRSSLNVHLRLHTGDKPYTCHLCKHSFVSKNYLKRHYKTCTGNAS